MRLGLLLAGAFVSLLMLPRTASAQCGPFATGARCSRATKHTIHVDFGLPKAAPKSPLPPVIPLPTVRLVHEPTAIDCGMVKPVDPTFHSDMPVLKPDPGVNLPTPIIRPPPCKR
jgi:hypothetical protein